MNSQVSIHSGANATRARLRPHERHPLAALTSLRGLRGVRVPLVSHPTRVFTGNFRVASFSGGALPIQLRHKRTSLRANTDSDNSTAPLANADEEAEFSAQTVNIWDLPASYKWEKSSDMGRSYAFLFATLAVGRLSGFQDMQFAYIVYFTALAGTTIYIGSHRSLCMPERKNISLKQGLLAPLLASGALLSVYLVLKYLPEWDLAQFLRAYSWLLGCFAIGGNLQLPLNYVLQATRQLRFTVPVPAGLAQDDQGNSVSQVSLKISDLVAIVVGVGLSTYNWANGSTDFTLNNLIATLILIDTLQIIGLNSYKTSVVLLGGLLLYDAFWVFGSSSMFGDNVMMTVATSDSFDGPFRLLFPRWEDVLDPPVPGSFPYALLGLGDIAVPGLLAGLMLRYDGMKETDQKEVAMASMAAFKKVFDEGTEDELDSGKTAIDAADAADAAYDALVVKLAKDDDIALRKFTKGYVPEEIAVRTYFNKTLAAYIGGLAIAFAANYITGAGQPALVYIVPCTLGATVALGIRQGELGRLWRFVDNSKQGSVSSSSR
ncbi:hypothetical protein CYMTET_48281 [Cymbomonas tetramitiformis]|uniref:Uncharacterized protein n=1 Tax=Cymbomonas tetramitiformis TaxID=36881 RepID=A0AAE0EVB0_9CHLO|nr:hypothetical protein CYMTET_48281 [Cymbomonas tetramitiformis]